MLQMPRNEETIAFYTYHELHPEVHERYVGHSQAPGQCKSLLGTQNTNSDFDATAPIYPQMQPRQTVRLRRRFGPFRMTMPVRIVYVIDEPNRKGFAFGTLTGHPVSGEVAFIVERHSDDSVHFILGSYSGPGKGLWVLAYPMVRLLRGGLRNTYFEALTGPLN